MLILGRRANQSIIFPHCGITVRILGINGRVAKIGIDAPRQIQVMRGELAMVSGDDAPRIEKASTQEDTEPVGSSESHPLVQFEQRLSHIKESLHVFQQMRAMGDEAQADFVLAELLEEIAVLDRDWLQNADPELESEYCSSSSSPKPKIDHVAESSPSYRVVSESTEPKYVLIVNDRSVQPDILFAGDFPNCQVCTVNSTELAKKAIEAGENMDCVVCNCNPENGENEKLIRAIRSKSTYENTMVLVVDDSKSTLEQIQTAANTGVDGWLTRPLMPKDLWNHLAESVFFEI